MNGATFAQHVRDMTKTNATTFTDAQIVRYANIVKDELAAYIVSTVDEGYFDLEMYRNLQAGIRDYTFVEDMLKGLKYQAAKLDGTKWEYLSETDFSLFQGENNPMMEEANIVSYFSGKRPQFYISGRSLKILNGAPIIDVVGGLKLVCEIYPQDITAGTLSSTDDLSVPTSDNAHALPRQVHEIWATKVIIKYKQSKDKPIPLTNTEKRVDIELGRQVLLLEKRNKVRSFIASVPQDDGQNY